MGDYIGGSPVQARAKYFQKNKDLLSSIIEISNRYKIDPYLLLHRLAQEGIIDKKIQAYNEGKESEPVNGTTLDMADYAAEGFGTDWGADRIKSGKIKLNRVIPFTTQTFINEHKEETHPALPFTNYDQMEIVAAQLKANQDKVNKDWPNSQIDKHAAIMAYYNGGDGNGKKWVESGHYMKYVLPKEYKNLLTGVKPSKTPTIDYSKSSGFSSYYNYFTRNNLYQLPKVLPMVLKQENSPVWDLNKSDYNKQSAEYYINIQKDKAIKDALGITKQQADSIMRVNPINYLNFFK